MQAGVSEINPRVTAIHELGMAVSLNRLDVIRALLARDELRGWGDETWAPDMGIQQLKPLECAIEKYYLEALDLLLENRQFPYDQALVDKCKSLASQWGAQKGPRLLHAKQILKKLKQTMGAQECHLRASPRDVPIQTIPRYEFSIFLSVSRYLRHSFIKAQ